MKRIYTSLLLMLVALLVPTTIWAADPNLDDYTLVKSVTWGDGTDFAAPDECAYTAWDTGNKRQQTLHVLTAPEDAAGWIALQAWANGGSGKGWWNRADKGLYCYNAGRSACVFGDDLTTGWLVVFECTQTASNVMTLTNGAGEPDGTFSYVASEDGKSYFCTITAAENAYVGFCGNKNAMAISKISVYKPNKAVVATTYTVNYVDLDGNTLKNAVTYDAVGGANITVGEADKANITVGEDTYVYDNDDAEGKTVAEDGSSVVTVKFHKAQNFSYVVNEVCGGVNARTTQGISYETANVTASYRKYNAVAGQLYTKDATSKEYNYKFTLTRNNQVENLDYTAVDGVTNVVFAAEGEDIAGLTPCTSANTGIRSSNSGSAFAAADTKIVKLSAGTYKLHAIIYDASKTPDSHWIFKAGETQIADFNCTTVNIQEFDSEEFTLAEDAEIILAAGGNNNMGLDALYITGTGNVVEEAPAELTIIDWVAAEQGYTNGEEVFDAQMDANILMVLDQGENSTSPKYYNTGSAIRLYGGNSFTISSATADITKIALTFASGEGSNEITTDVATYADGTWTGAAKSVTFTIGGTSGHRRIAKIHVVYGGIEPDVEPVHIANTAETAYTVAEAFGLIDAGEALDETVFVKGIVSKVDSYNEQYKSITYWISADGTTEGQQLQCYGGKGLEGADFASKDDVKVGANVIVTGLLKKYRDTYELDSNNKLVSYEAPAPDYFTFDGVAYIIDTETGKFMAAGHDWGTRGIVNATGLDLTFTTNTQTKMVTIDSRVSNGGDNHFLGSNLYMDSPAAEWGLLYQGFGFWITDGAKYISIDENDNLVLSDQPREWIIVTADGVKAQRLEEMAEATKDAPVDVTYLLQNPNFNRNDQRVSAWQVSENCTNKNLNGGNNLNNCAESYHSVFTISQTLTDAPKGVYALTAQGFYRQDGSDNDNLPVFFANDETQPVPVKAGTEDDMAQASESFTSGLYTIEPIYVEVAEGGTLTVGVKNEANTSLWVIFDNFQLTYFGPNSKITDFKEPVVEPTEDAIFDLTADMFYNWDGYGADASKTSPATVDFNVGSELNAGGMVAGTGSVFHLVYADLTGSTKMIFEGTPGVQLRVLMNRQESDSGPLTEKNPVIGEDGKVELDLTGLPYVHLNAIKTGWSSPAGTITAIKLVKPNDPLALPKESLKNAISAAKLQNAVAKTEESFAALTQAIAAAEAALAAADATAESLAAAEAAVKAAVDGLTLAEGYENLTQDMFKHWDSATEPTTGEAVGCAYELFVPSGLPYGDGNVGFLNFADLSEYDQLIVTAIDGTPRIMMNRDVDQGQWNENEAESHLIESVKDGWSSKYFTAENGVYTVDLKQLVADKGIANLNAIKGANWANVTVTGMYLKKAVAIISETTVTYAIQEGETHTAGEAVEVKNEAGEVVATLTFGFEGGADFKAGKAHAAIEGFVAFTEGNGENGKADSGTTYIIAPKYDGNMTVGVVLNANKAFYVLENETALADYDGIKAEEKYYGPYSFPVKGGSTYKVFCTGSKLGFYGFNYTYGGGSVEPVEEDIIKNAEFAGDPVPVGICTYAKDMDGNGTTMSGMQEVPEWEMGVENGDARAAGVFAIGGSAFLGGQGYVAPTVGPNGETEGTLLGMVGVWTGTVQYVQNVTLPAGTYTLTVPIYNVGGTETPEKGLFGFIADNNAAGARAMAEGVNGEYLAPANAYTVGEWKNEVITFNLDEETTGRFSLGYTGKNVGSGKAPHLFIGKLTLDVKTLLDGAKEELNAEIATAEAQLADETKTEGRAEMQAAIDAAKAQLAASDLAAVNAAIAALQAAEAAFAEANAPKNLIEEGTYYVYNAYADKFLARGSSWGTRAVGADYGVAVNVAKVADGVYTLQSFDNNAYYGDDYWMYADCTGDRMRSYKVEAADGGYTLRNQNRADADDNRMYIYMHMEDKDDAADLWALAGNAILGDNINDDAQTVWQFLTPAEYEAKMAARNAAEKAAAFQAAGISEADELKDGESGVLSFKAGNNWTQTVVRTQGGQPGINEFGTEMWQATGSFTQKVENLPQGLYRVSINAFYRDGSNAETVTRFETGLNTVLAYMEANGSKAQVKSWALDRVDDGNPNTMAQAAELFAQGKYLSETYAYVGEDGVLNVTVANPAFIGNGWFITGDVTYTRLEELYIRKADAYKQLAIDPANNSKNRSLQTFTLSMTDGTGVQNLDGHEDKATLTNNTTGTVYEMGISTSGINALVFTTSNEAITELGEYTLTIPAGTLQRTIDEALFPELQYSFIIEPAPMFETGKYYLANVGAQRFWGAGNDWGTRASLVMHPEYVTLNVVDAATNVYTLESQVSNGGTAYYFEGDYMDNANAKQLTIAQLENGFYTISADGKYYGYDGTSTVLGKDVDAATANGQWIILNDEQMMAELATAKQDDPVDATWLMLDPNFGRNNRNADAWQKVEGNPNLSGGNNVNNNAESYMAAFEIAQTLNGVPNGIYKLEAQAAVTFHDNRTIKPYDGNGYPVVFAGNATSNFLEMSSADQLSSQSKMSEQFTAGYYNIEPIFFEVLDGTIRLGAKSDRADIWAVWDNFELTYFGPDANINTLKFGDKLDQLADLREQAEALKSEVEVAAVTKVLDDALAATANVERTTAAIDAALNTLTNAVDKGQASVKAKNVLPQMKELTESTNFYTQEAYDTYYGNWEAKYEAGTLTKSEADALQDPFLVTGWHAAITVDDLLLSVWDTNPDFVDAPYYINTWSVEGESDGSEFKVPFFEYWTGDDSSLGEKTLTATLTGLQPGVYNVGAQVRVRGKNSYEAPAYGITMQVCDGQAVDVTAGQQVGTSQFYLDNFTAKGTVASDGVLTLKFQVAADNNISWLSFKNVKYAYDDVATGILTVGSRQNAEGVYSISGQKVEKTRKGLYIQNGKKVVIK